MTISLVLVDDWELRGDGSGDMEKIQFGSLSGLLEVYEAFGLRASINAEVMQQLQHRRAGEDVRHLAALADRWQEVVLDVYRRGHDVQLHVHSQWEDARYENGKWILSGNWSILTYPRDRMVHMVRECRAYLEGLLRTVNPTYRCVSFRSGAWAIAPSPDILSVLAEEGFTFDMSIVGGMRYQNAVIALDYSECEEAFLPYYPRMTDARRVSSVREPLICVPTLSFVPSRAAFLKRDLRRLGARIRKALTSPPAAQVTRSAPPSDYQVWSAKRGIAAKIMARCFPTVAAADLSALNFDMMKQMVNVIRRRARERGCEQLPVILENHTKDIVDFGDIRRFAEYVSRQPDIDVISLTELAGRLERGDYPVVTRGSPFDGR